ncbi:hypothetical protein EDB85DRAFT_1886242 [Lactarius pseudohatsudake]|nr:hypothetical protein EDB85DRAFT_1886242 [Lactarius pseudohatsudake]
MEKGWKKDDLWVTRSVVAQDSAMFPFSFGSHLQAFAFLDECVLPQPSFLGVHDLPHHSLRTAPFISRLKALGVLLRAFPSAVAAARPSSLSDLRPTAVYGWTVSVDLPGSYGKSPIGNPYYHTINCVPGPVHCITENGIWLAVGSGKAVQLVKQATIATWECTRLLPDPIKFPELDGELPEPMARSLHFLGGGSLLLVMYLDHGVIAWNLKTLEIKWHIRPRTCKIGCSIVSHNEKILALTNLYDGIDWYSLDSNHFMDASYQHTTTHPIPDNVILPITFVHGNSAVLSGTSDGCARITTVTDWALAERFRHNPGDIVQALAYSSSGDARQIVTGVSERAAGLVIRYWIQESGPKKPAQLKSQGEMGQGRAYLTGYTLVSIVIITCNLVILLAATQLDWTAMSANGAKGPERVEKNIYEFAMTVLVLPSPAVPYIVM